MVSTFTINITQMWVSIPHMDGMGYTETLNVVTVVQYAAPVEKKEAIVPASIE